MGCCSSHAGASKAPAAGQQQQRQQQDKDTYNKLDSILDILASGDVALVSAKWLLAHSETNGILPMRQKLPENVTVSSAELKRIHETAYDQPILGAPMLNGRAATKRAQRAPFVAASYCWKTAAHPDPDGEQLQVFAKALKGWQNGAERLCNRQTFEVVKGNIRFEDVGAFFDWCSLYQMPRTPEQTASFKRSLASVNVWYGHVLGTVFLLTVLPKGSTRTQYSESGWPTFERAVATLYKPLNDRLYVIPSVVDLGTASGKAKIFSHPTPDEFNKELAKKHFTNGADIDIVSKKYKETMETILGSVVTLDRDGLDWGDEEVRTLVTVLPLCNCVEHIALQNNRISDEGATLLADAISNGLPALRSFFIMDNRLGAVGRDALKRVMAERSLMLQL